MRTHLRLVSSNPQRTPGHHHAGAALHALALCLAGHARKGNTRIAHAIAHAEALTPIEIGIVSTWMVQAGINEAKILSVLTEATCKAGEPSPRLSA